MSQLCIEKGNKLILQHPLSINTITLIDYANHLYPFSLKKYLFAFYYNLFFNQQAQIKKKTIFKIEENTVDLFLK